MIFNSANKNLVSIRVYGHPDSLSTGTVVRIAESQHSTTHYGMMRGHKHYELSNHLGNVLVVITDQKHATCQADTVTHYTAQVTSGTDYSPFGAPLPERTFEGERYRFGFNGMEKIDEVLGGGNLYTAEHWQYSPRLGRRFNVDPVYKSDRSDYSVLSNSPIIYVDPFGDDDFYNRAGKYVGSYGDGTEIRVINHMVISSKESFKEAMNIQSLREKVLLAPTITIQADAQQAISDLYNNNSKPGNIEKNAYIILDVEKATLGIVVQAYENNTSNTSTNEYMIQPSNIYGNYTTVKGDKNQVIVGQIHTHPPNADGSFPAPKVSEEGGPGVMPGESDVTTANRMNIPVHAIDGSAIHKVSANGAIQNGLSRSTEILKSSLEESGGKAP